LVKTTQFLLYVSLFTPLIVGVNYLFPYVFTKATFFEAIIEIAFLAYVLLLAVDKNYLPRKNILLIGLGVWLLGLITSTFLAVDPYLAFWSKAERMDGLFWYLHLFLFFVMVVSVFKNEVVGFLTINSLAGGFVGAAALISKFFPSILNFGNQGRLAGTFGNPAFLATYFLVLVFLNLLAYLLSSDSWKKIFLVLAGFSFILVFLSGTRGAYVGLVGGIVLFCSLILVFRGRQYLKPVLIGLSVLVLTLSSFWFLPGFWQKASPFLASRIYALWEIPKPRLIVWQIGWNAFLEKPIFGWGPENFLYAFNKHFIPEIHTYEVAIFDRPHNKIIDLLVTQGIIGLLIYLFLFCVMAFSFLKFLWKNKEDEQEVLVYSLFLGLLGAYFVQNLVLFEMPTSGIVLFIIFALAYWFINNEKTEIRVVKENQRLSFSAFIVCSVLISLSFYRGIILPEKAARNTANSAYSMLPSQSIDLVLKRAKDYYQVARGLDTFLNKEVDISIARRLRDFSTVDIFLARTPEYKEFVLEIVKNLQRDLEAHPFDYDVAVEAGALLMQVEGEFQDKLSEDSEAYNLFSQATVLAPKREDAYQYLFLWTMRNNKQLEAKSYVDVLLGLNSKLGVFWFYLAEYEARWGSLEEMAIAREKAKENGYDIARRLGDWELLISSLILGEKDQAAISELEKILAIPNLPLDFFIRDSIFLIQLYLKGGNRIEAKSATQDLLVRVPEQNQQEVINHLKQNSWWVE
jgi:O-antigen ligase